MALAKRASLAMVAVFAGLIGRAEDSYLYWLMDNYETQYQFDGARIGVVEMGSTTYLTIGMNEAYVDVNGNKSFVEMYTCLAGSQGREGCSYMLELLNSEGIVEYASEGVSWNRATIVTSDRLNSAAPMVFTVRPVPEPTGGLFVVIGIAVLALCRRRSRGAALALMLPCAFVARAAYDDTMVCFSTRGPDRYADGTIVADGERYALVWSEDGIFEGFQADGLPVDSRDDVLAVVSAAKGGRCPLSSYPLAADRFVRGGVLALWLLDTRVYASDGTVSLSAAEGPARVSAVSAAAKVTADIVVAPGICGTPKTLSDVTPAPTAVPAGTPQPVVRDIRVDTHAGLVYLTVSNTVPYLTYGVRAGAEPSVLPERAARNPVTGGGEITLIVEKNGGSRFFSVRRAEQSDRQVEETSDTSH